MIQIILTLLMAISIGFAKERFSKSDQEKFIKEVEMAFAQGKVERQQPISFEIIKPDFIEELEFYYYEGKLTRKEFQTIKNNFDSLASKNISSKEIEPIMMAFIKREFDEINKRQVPIQAEGQLCNSLSCQKGLQCAPDPIQSARDNRKVAGATCRQDSECASYECIENNKGAKVCEETRRCFKPLSLGQSCLQNPVCGSGTCLEYNSMTSGIGECAPKKYACTKNSDCCSNSCLSGKCVDNKVCKDCVSNGKKPQRGKKCCEGLYINKRGICAPDVPPSVILKVYNKIISPALFSLELIFQVANAQDTKVKEPEFKNKVELENELIKEIKTNIRLSEGGKEISTEIEEENEEEKKREYTFKARSDFESCSIDLYADFLEGLGKEDIVPGVKAIDLEMSLLAFEYTVMNAAAYDYLRTSKHDGKTSLYGRLNNAAKNFTEQRKATLKKVEENNKKVTCLCLDVKGLDGITDAEKKQFFMEECEEYAKYKDAPKGSDGKFVDETLGPDASGLKQKAMIVESAELLKKLHQDLAIEFTRSTEEMEQINSWAQSFEWDSTEYKNYDLFKFLIRGNMSDIGRSAIAGALLAAGVVGIVAGFSVASFLNVWAIAGIIAASSISATSVWMYGSLQGAWSGLRPQINDYHVAPKSVGCGKKATCTEYTRTLMQPYNKLCDSHISSKACIVKFVNIETDNGEVIHLLDPWMPKNLNLDGYIYPGDLAKDLEKGFVSARQVMTSKKPSGQQTNDYLTKVFIDTEIAGKYLSQSMTTTTMKSLDKEFMNKFLEDAKKYAVAAQVIKEDDTENLEAFAFNAYYYHFVYPKATKVGELSYPTVGIQHYINLLARETSGNLAAYFAKEAMAVGEIENDYSKDLANTIKVFKDKPTYAGSPNQVKNYIDDIEKKNNERLSKFEGVKNAFDANSLNSIGSSLSGHDKDFLNSVFKLREMRDNQLGELSNYNNQMRTAGAGDRAQIMSAISKDFLKEFSTGKLNGAKANSISAQVIKKDLNSGKIPKVTSRRTSKSGSGDSSISGSLGSSGINSGRIGQLGAVSNDPNSDMKSYLDQLNGLSDNGVNGSTNWGSRSSSGQNSGNSIEDGQSNYNSSMSGDALASNQDIMSAIEARDKNGIGRYGNNEEDTLFKIITNAYIRNYDKVLQKRQSKDTIENK